MKILFRNSLLVFAVILFITSCSKVPLNRDEFTSLLIDMHKLDGVLLAQRNEAGMSESDIYSYYGKLYSKYGISKTDFDTCMSYYSRDVEGFIEIYDVVMDSINKELTRCNIVMKRLRVNDSVNILANLSDTIVLNPDRRDTTFRFDSLTPGYYRFTVMFRFDSVDAGKNNKMISYFLHEKKRRDTITMKDSVVGYDTLYLAEQSVLTDTMEHKYQWLQYIDSCYTILGVHMMQSSNTKDLKNRYGKINSVGLYQLYTSELSKKRYVSELRRRENDIKYKRRKDSIDKASAKILKRNKRKSTTNVRK